MSSRPAIQSPSKTPGWHRPDKLFRRIQLGKKRSKRLASANDVAVVPASHCSFSCDASTPRSHSTGGKRQLESSFSNATDEAGRNPFSVTSPKKFISRAKRFKPAPAAVGRAIVADCNTVADPADFPRLFLLLGNGSKHHRDSDGSCSQPTDFSSMLEDNLPCDASALTGNDGDSRSGRTFPNVPLHFTLASKLRILTCDNLPKWLTTFDTEPVLGDEHFGISGSEVSGSQPSEVAQPMLHRAMYYWSFPSLPKVTDFPRFVSSATDVGKYRLPNRVATGRDKTTFATSLCPSMVKDFGEKWHDCFHALRKSTEAGRCPLFYLCCPSCTVLFLAAGTGGNGCMTAVITPTTKGLRHALKDDDIEYFMPLRKRGSSSSLMMQSSLSSADSNSQSQQSFCSNSSGHPLLQHSISLMEPLPSTLELAGGSCCEEEGETENDGHDTSGELDFLEAVGISPRYRNKFKKRIERSDSMEKRGESTVVVYDVTENSRNNVKKLISFICSDSKHMWAAIGPQSGHPPTIVSPVQFVDGTMHRLKITTGTIKRDSITINSVEVSGGPIMPPAVFALCSTLEKQLGSFSFQWLGAEAYQPLNIAAGLKDLEDRQRKGQDGHCDSSRDSAGDGEEITDEWVSPKTAESGDATSVGDWLRNVGRFTTAPDKSIIIERNVFVRKVTFKDGVYHS